jgi:hypothetical protein
MATLGYQTRNPGGLRSIGETMRTSFFVFMFFVVACTQHNPDLCCSTTTQCADFGLDNITGCMSGKTCDSTGTCVAAQCTTSADCTSADAPICENQMCVAKCTTDDECVGISGRPFCATDGACVACVMDSQCTTADAPVCDTTSRSCRGCSDDGECTGGICLESEGTCKADSDVFFVATVGVDSGECTRSSPCATIPFVLAKAQPPNKTIHLLGGAYNVGATTLQIGSACYIDATNTIVTSSANGPVLDYTFSLGGAVLNNVTVVGSNQTSTNVAITAEINGTLKIYNSTIKRGLKMTGGTVSISRSTFTNPTIAVSSVDCTSGTVSIDTSTITNARVTTMGCNVTLERNRFDVTDDQCFDVTGGNALIENNLLTAQSETDDCGFIQGVTSGSTVRFNTFASVSDLVADGTALHCDSTADVTSNIFAWGSTSPHGSSVSCAPTYSLYDTTNTVPITVTSFSGDASTFFVNKGAMDFHLSTASPAIGKAEQGLDDTTDFDGNPRPSPSGSVADVGAYEAP